MQRFRSPQRPLSALHPIYLCYTDLDHINGISLELNKIHSQIYTQTQHAQS